MLFWTIFVVFSIISGKIRKTKNLGKSYPEYIEKVEYIWDLWSWKRFAMSLKQNCLFALKSLDRIFV